MKFKVSRQHLPVIATLFVLVSLYITASVSLEGFFSLKVFVNFLGDNAFLGIVAIGMTYVIITGGIDLSVGAIVGCTTICAAVLIEEKGLHPLVAFSVLLAAGVLVGTVHGVLIQKFGLQPFLVTLAGLFLYRGLGLWLSTSSIQADHGFFDTMYNFRLSVGDGVWLPFTAILFLTVLVASSYVLRYTRFGRTVYAIGGDEQSAVLMGLPVVRTKIGVYAFSGFCAALGGLTFVAYTSAGNALNGTGLELDAIAAVVIGGTLLTGGYGSVIGSFFGLLIFAVIQTAIIFEGTLSSWWSRIAMGVLLLVFILLQRAVHRVK